MTKQELQGYIDMLPIGLYLGSKISVDIDTQSETSYFTPEERKIFLSLPCINKQVAIAKTYEQDIENVVRNHLYHELSHAILTPQALKVNDIVNIVEDARIEWVLKDYYHGVDFKASVLALNGIKKGEIPPYPTNPYQLFYSVLRYGIGTKEQLEDVERFLREWKELNWNSQNYIEHYNNDIKWLYRRITKSNPPPTPQEWEEQWGTLLDEVFGNEGQADENPQEKQSTKEPNKLQSSMEKQLEHLLQDVTEQTIDTKFMNAVEDILLSYQKKNNKGSSQANYSGRLNARNVQRDDYRYFDRRATAKSVNPYGSLHLNLFIDNSGSYASNVNATNAIITALLMLEKKYKFFTFTVATAGEMVHPLPKSKPYITAECGNFFTADDIKTVKSMQKNDTFTYNILLQDGCGYANEYAKLEYYYQPFDMYNCTMILDKDCETSKVYNGASGEGFERVQKAKIIVVNGKYAENLKENILKTLRMAFR